MGLYHPLANLFEGESRSALIDKLGDPLKELNSLIKWEEYRPLLEEYFPTVKSEQGGRPRMDPLMMFKVLILEKLYDLSDRTMEYQIADRLSFQRFLGIHSTEGIPDEKTIWLFREQIKDYGLMDRLFDDFVHRLKSNSLIVNQGKIVDASLVRAPKQRNSREDNAKLTDGELPEEWEKNPHKNRQKDKDATWVKKNGVSEYGYKDHIKVDSDSKLIEDYQVTPNSVDDSQVLEDVLSETDRGQKLYADSAYRSSDIEEQLKEMWIKSHIHEKGYRNKTLTEKQKRSNRKKSRVRARVEHVFGYFTQKMNGLKVKCIGLARASVQIGLYNLVYNIDRAIYLMKRKGITVPK